ncbi:MAG TPA: diguanylate cyclase [Candidatus Mcinerneyibacteriales bacterium]|nr:diguanylate cyclase [Candidatus Mcinerneyibacteriales bacterium]
MKKKLFERQIEEAKSLLGSDPGRAALLLEELLRTPRISKRERAQLLIELARSYRHTSQFRRSLESFQEALELAEKKGFTDIITDALNGLGIVYRHLEDYENALREYFRLLPIYEKMDDYKKIAVTYNNIGVVYRHLEEREKTLEFYFKALDLYELAREEWGYNDTLCNIGLIFCDLGEYDSAGEYVQRSLRLRAQAGDEKGIGISEHNLGLIELKKRNFQESRKHYRRSLHIFHKRNDSYAIAKNLEALAECFQEEGRNTRALQLYQRALSIAESLALPEMHRDIQEKVALLYEKSGDAVLALAHYKTFHEENEKLAARNKEDTLEKIMMQHEIERKKQEAEIYRLRNVELNKAKTMLQKKKRELEVAYSRLQELANHDTLTGLANRRYFMEHVESELIRFERNHKNFVIIVGDLDGFKRFNDQYGHDCGDFLLLQVARAIQKALRKQDVAARWGGEEFILLLPETDLRGGEVTAEKIRHNLEQKAFDYKGKDLKVTITFGVSVYDGTMPVAQTVIEADQALYLGKRMGKNRVQAGKEPVTG